MVDGGHWRTITVLLSSGLKQKQTKKHRVKREEDGREGESRRRATSSLLGRENLLCLDRVERKFLERHSIS